MPSSHFVFVINFQSKFLFSKLKKYLVVFVATGLEEALKIGQFFDTVILVSTNIEWS